MQTTNKRKPSIEDANLAVSKAYEAIIKEVKDLLPQFPSEQLRTYVERTSDDVSTFFSPMVFISVGNLIDERIISFAKNPEIKSYVGLYFDTAFTRCIISIQATRLQKSTLKTGLKSTPTGGGTMKALCLRPKLTVTIKRLLFHPNSKRLNPLA